MSSTAMIMAPQISDRLQEEEPAATVESEGLDDLREGIATIASTAAHVRLINTGLDDLQAQLAMTYPMTEEEKATSRLPLPPSSDAGHKSEQVASILPMPEEEAAAEPSQPHLDTIVAAHDRVRQINVGLDDLRAQLEANYPMTEEEKAANRLALRLDSSVAGLDRLSSDAGKPGRALSLTDACAVLRGAARNTSQFSDADAALCSTAVMPSRFDHIDGSEKRLPLSGCNAYAKVFDFEISAYEQGAEDAIGAANCGVELRKATQVLKRRLQAGIASR